MNPKIRQLLERGIEELRSSEQAVEIERAAQETRQEAEAKEKQRLRIESLFERGLPECFRSVISDEDENYGRVILRVEGLAPIWAYLDGNGRLYYRVPGYRRNYDDNAERHYAFADFHNGYVVDEIGRALAWARRAEAERAALEEEIEQERKARENESPMLYVTAPTLAEKLESVVREIVYAVLAERGE